MSNLTPFTSTLLRMRDHLKDEMVRHDGLITFHEMAEEWESMAYYERLYDEAKLMLMELNVLLSRLEEAGVIRYE